MALTVGDFLDKGCYVVTREEIIFIEILDVVHFIIVNNFIRTDYGKDFLVFFKFIICQIGC